MAVDDAQIAIVPESKSPYQLNSAQTTKACNALLRHIIEEKKRKESETTKPNLLASSTDVAGEDADIEDNDVPVWLILSTKQHIVDQKRLKPGKITLPHPIHTSSSSTICLITADPQRMYKDVISSPEFPVALRNRITRVVSISKLKTKYKAFEARRKLAAEHEIFLADDRIIVYLPQFLGKVFYKGGNKRPVPVNIAGPAKRDEQGKRVKRRRPPGVRREADEEAESKSAPAPEALAKELSRALDSAVVHLAPGTSTAVKVARARFDVDMCTANIKAVVDGLVSKFVTKGWRNVRAIHIKGPESMAFPIWMAEQLWVDDKDVLTEKKTFGKKSKQSLVAAEDTTSEVLQKPAARDEEDTRKRKAARPSRAASDSKHVKKKRKADLDERIAAEAARRKEVLKQQKAQILASTSQASI